MPNQSFPTLAWNWWRRRQCTAAASAVSLLILTLYYVISNPNKTTSKYSIDSSALESNWVPLTLLANAQEKGAFCLDGSVPGYHIQMGSGSGSHNWLLHVEGGGWCSTEKSCSTRKRLPLGSSVHMEQQVQFFGILSNDPSENPDFFSWTKVKIRYCDGASFSGHPGSESKNGTKLFFRGQIIWDAIMDELSSLGLSRAKQALLTGCSAGALATLIHCDDFREILGKDANVKCLSDGGFFLNVKDIAGRDSIELFYQDVVHLQGVVKSLNKDCLSKVEPHKCFFPQEFVKNIKTPIFLVNPAYDWWQIQNVLIPDASDPEGSWFRCKQNIYNCNPDQLKMLHGFRDTMMKIFEEFQETKETGYFVDSCFSHCQTWKAETWHSPTSPRINNKTIAEAVGDWYFNLKAAKHMDCPFPCNPTCVNHDFTPHL